MMFPTLYTIIGFDTIGSTNDEAKARADTGAPHGTVIWAKTQTAGRGRRGRAWVSPPGNLYTSLILRHVELATAGQLTFVAALAIADAVKHFVSAGDSVQVKWPNDVVVDGAKISGLLLEADLQAPDPWVVIGIGINLAFYPPETPYPATSLLNVTGVKVEPEAMLAQFLLALQHWENIWREEGFKIIRQAWLARAMGKGQPLIARLPHEECQGVFEDMDESGALVLCLADGTRRRIYAADVFLTNRKTV